MIDWQMKLDTALGLFREHATKDWHAAGISMVGAWPVTTDNSPNKLVYRLIGGEAMDWRQVIKLGHEADSTLFEKYDVASWLRNSDIHGDVGAHEFTDCLGEERYKAHLNFFYGVKVERSLLSVTVDDLVKNVVSCGGPANSVTRRQAYKELYGVTYIELKSQFQQYLKDSGIQVDLSDIEAEFRYWLFKFRLNNSERVKTASDTKRGLDRWHREQATSSVVSSSSTL